jgi:hypothetical protein
MEKKKVFSITWTMPLQFTVYLEAETEEEAFDLFWIKKAYTWKSAEEWLEPWKDSVNYKVRVEEEEPGRTPSLPIPWD